MLGGKTAMTPLVLDRIHLLLEWLVCGLLTGALVLRRRRNTTRSSSGKPDIPEEAILEHAKTQVALLREVNHRVKNNFSSLIGLLQMKRDYARTPEEAGHLKDMEIRLAGLAAVHNMLSLNGWRPIGLGELCRVLIQKTTGLAGIPCTITIQAGPPDVLLPHSLGHHLTLIINELISNTIRHGHTLNTSLAIRVTIDTRENEITLRFADDGPGYPIDILHAQTSARGSGLQIIQALATSSLGGKFTLEHDHGAVACITFPRKPLTAEMSAS
jgi:two-component sensor histidine kinase